MHCYGDASGTLNNVLDDREPVFTVAIVAGDAVDAGACPQKFISRHTDLQELKWGNISNDPMKRRVIECLADRTPELEFAYASVTRSELVSCTYSFSLLQDGHLPVPPAVFVKGVMYGTLLDELGMRTARDSPTFYFDKFGGKSNWESLKQQLTEMHGNVEHRWASSRRRKGIQAADCIAGAVRSDWCNGSEWASYLPSERTYDCSRVCLTKIEAALDSVRTAP